MQYFAYSSCCRENIEYCKSMLSKNTDKMQACIELSDKQNTTAPSQQSKSEQGLSQITHHC